MRLFIFTIVITATVAFEMFHDEPKMFHFESERFHDEIKRFHDESDLEMFEDIQAAIERNVQARLVEDILVAIERNIQPRLFEDLDIIRSKYAWEGDKFYLSDKWVEIVRRHDILDPDDVFTMMNEIRQLILELLT